MNPRLKDIGEFGLIRLLSKGLCPGTGTIVGVGDDAAVIRGGSREDWLFTTDIMVEDVHFKRLMNPEGIGRKAMAVNLSDIAAMGGKPTFAVVSLGVPADLSVSFAQRLYRGMNTIARRFRVGIVGGDTVKSPRIIINVALLGRVGKGQAVLRSGAKPGDWIFLTGPVGGSYQSGRHLTFVPKIKEADFLVKNYSPSAMIDVSDGLAADLGHILEQSRVGAVIHVQNIPHPRGVSLEAALSQGEDFELLFTLNPSQARRLMTTRRPYHFFHIGEIVPKRQGLKWFDPAGRERTIKHKGYRHF